MYIDYDYYRIFYYVAKYRSFTRAANILVNSQPNITRAVRKLEEELGCSLFIRSNRGVRLTVEGEKLYGHIRIAVEQIQEGERELSKYKSLEEGIVSIGVSEVALRCYLLPVLKEYQKRYPGIRLRVSNHATPQAIAALRQGLADIALVTTPMETLAMLEVRKVKPIQEIAVCGTSFRELAKKQVSLAELSNYPMISLGPQTKTYEFYSDWFFQCGVSFVPDIEAATADQILPMVRNNLGIGFVPEEFLQGEESTHIFPVCLKEQIPLRSVCLIKRRGAALSVAAQELERMIINACPDGQTR